MTRSMRAGALAWLALTIACSETRTPPPPTTPTPPLTSPLGQPASLPAVITGEIEFPKFDPLDGWTFAARGQNVGQGCAANVRGTAHFRDAGGALLQTVEFSLDAGKRVQAAETFLFQACCLTEANKRTASTVAFLFSWENVNCQ